MLVDEPITSTDPASGELTVAGLLSRAATCFAHAELLVTPDRRLSYAEAARRSRELARRLVAVGVGKGSRAGILLPNGVEWALSWFATARTGALMLPLSTYLEAPEFGRMLRHGDVQFLIMVSALLGRDYLKRLEIACRVRMIMSSHSPLICRVLLGERCNTSGW